MQSKGAIKSPLLLALSQEVMIDKGEIENIVNDYYKETEKFLVEVNVSSGNHVAVFIDGDNGIKVSDCIELSRHIESLFDRDKEDFALDVSSAGIGKSFAVKRQYYKNIGKEIAVVTNDGIKHKGVLKEVKDEGIEIDIKPFLSKKQLKEQPETLKFIQFDNLKEAKIILSFN